MTINPCRACGDIPVVTLRGTLSGLRYRLTHECVTPLHATEEAAIAMWNRDNPPDEADNAAQAGQGEG